MPEPVVSRSGVFTRKNGSNICYYLTHFNGTWAVEMQVEEEELTHGIKVIESKKGVRTTQSESPSFLLSLDGPSREDSGEVYAGSLAWSGNYRLSFELDETGRLGMDLQAEDIQENEYEAGANCLLLKNKSA